MRFRSYIRNNIKQKPGRTVLVIFGIMLSVVDILVMSLIIGKSMNTTSSFFLPFSHMDQIIERGTDFTQLVPYSSMLNESLQPNIEAFFDESTIPMLMIAETEEVGTLFSTYYLGLPLESMEIIWDQIMLASGHYPTLTSQVIVGQSWAEMSVMEIKGVEFTVTGILNDMHTFFDRVVVMDLSLLQELVNKEGLVTLFFISPEFREYPLMIEQFETEFTAMDFLTLSERDKLRGGMNQFFSEIGTLFTTFTAISAIIFVLAIELLTILNRKGDFNVFFVLGAPKIRIFLVLLFELFLMFFISIVLSIPISIVIYILLWSYVNIISKVDVSFWPYTKGVTYDLFQHFPTTLLLSRIGLILIFGLIFAIIIANIGLRSYKLEEMKQKF